MSSSEPSQPSTRPPRSLREALFARLIPALKVVGLFLGILVLAAIFSLGAGVERYVRQLAAALAIYGAVIDFCAGWLVDLASTWLIELIRRYVPVGEHWRHVFTFLTLYTLADAFQFFARRDKPEQDPAARPLLPIDNEVRMGLTSFFAGVLLAVAAAAAVGMAPLDRSLASGLTMVGAAVGAVFVYWIVIALAHAFWNRWNYAQRVNPPQAVEPFGLAFRRRAMMAVRRSLGGLVLGMAVWGLVWRFTPAPAPGLIALGALAFALGGFWIWRAWDGARGEGSWLDRWRRAGKNDNRGMGIDIALRVAGGAAVAVINWLMVG